MLKTILGKRGKGKTRLAKQIARSEPADQIFILDWLAEYHDLNRPNVKIFYDDLYACFIAAWNQADRKKKTLMIFDEIDLYGKNNEYIDYLYRYGRHANIEIIAVARRFYDLPVIVRSQTNIFYVFQITEERDLNYLKNIASRDQISKIIRLKDLEYLTINL